MYLRKIKRHKDGKTHGYWALVESYRTARGPRQRVVAYLGEMDASGRLSVRLAAENRRDYQADVFDELQPKWIEVNLKGVRVDRVRDFGDIWLARELIQRLGRYDFFHQVIPPGREKIRWAKLALVLLIARFCDPCSELYLAEHYYGHTALADLLGIADAQIYDNRLYRAMDHLLPHKEDLEKYLKHRFGQLFQIKYDLLLYDVTSTYFEGEAVVNPQAQRGYSRDKRPDCKQGCIALVVMTAGIPLGYELFAGNRHDSTTVQEIVETMERRYGMADGIWVMDRGMIGDENIAFFKQHHRRDIIGTPKSLLKQFEQQLLAQDWHTIQPGLEVQSCRSPFGDSERCILCRSSSRNEKEQAILQRFCHNIEDWSAEQLWQAYIQLTDVEAAFRIHKTDLVLRPIWHQKQHRVAAHIFVCCLAFVLWKCLAQMCNKAGLGNEPRKVIDEIKRIKLADVILTTRKGIDIKLQCVSQPDPHQKMLLQRLGIH